MTHATWYDPSIWQHLFYVSVPIIEKLLRTVAVYIFLFSALRLFGRRELVQLNPFDLIVLLLLSNTVQNAIIGDDNSLLGGVFGAMVLLAINYTVVRFFHSHHKLERLVEGDPLVLVRDGHIVKKHLERELITREELEAAARRQGIDSLEQVACARLEVGGALTFVPMNPSAEDMRHRELLQKLERLEHRLEKIAHHR